MPVWEIELSDGRIVDVESDQEPTLDALLPVLKQYETSQAASSEFSKSTDAPLAQEATLQQSLTPEAMEGRRTVDQPFDIAKVAEPEPFNPIQAEAVMNTPLVSPEALKNISPLSRILPSDSLAGGYERGLREIMSGVTTPAALSIAPAFTVPYLAPAAGMVFGAKTLGESAGRLTEAQTPAEAGGALAGVVVGTGMVAGGAPAVRRAAAEAAPAGRLAYELRDAQMTPAGLPTTAQVREAGLREAAMPEAVRMTQRILEARAKQILREMEAPKPTPERPLRSEDVTVKTRPKERIEDAVQQQSKEVSGDVLKPEVPQESAGQVPARPRGEEVTEALKRPRQSISERAALSETTQRLSEEVKRNAIGNWGREVERPATAHDIIKADAAQIAKDISKGRISKETVAEGIALAERLKLHSPDVIQRLKSSLGESTGKTGEQIRPDQPPQAPEALTPEEAPVEAAASTGMKIGDEQVIMQVPSTLADTKTIEGVRWDIFNGSKLREKRSAVRVIDTDSGEVLRLKQFPDYDAAEAYYKSETAKAEKLSQPAAETVQEPSSAQSIGIAPEGSELIQRAIEFFTPPTPSGVPQIKIQHGARVPRFQDPATQKLLATSPQGMAKFPVLGQIMDPRAKAHTPADVSLITRAYSVEQGKTFAALWAQTQNRNKELFVADEETGTIPLTDGTRGYMSDVIEAELREPGSQALTQEQREWIKKEWIPFRNDIDQMLKDEGTTEIVDEEFEYQVGKDYFPRPAVGKRGLPVPGAGGRRPGAKQFFEKGRIYETEAEGARPAAPGEKKDQIIYDPNAISRGSKLLAGAYRAVADHRLANDPALEGRTVEQRFQDLVDSSPGLELLGKEEKAEAMQALREQAARPSWIRERQVTAGPAFYGKIYPAEVADKIEKMFRMESSHIIQAAQTVTATSKAMLAVGDLSQFMIQGAAILGAHPVIWSRAMANSIESLANPDVVARLLEEPHMIKSAEEFTQSGGTLFRLQDFLAGAKKGAPIESVPVVGPTITRLGHAYGAFLDMAKLQLWKAYSPVTPREQWGKLTETIENSVFMGRMESIGMNPGRALAERLLFFAPAYYRGAGNLVTSALGRDVSAKVARRMLGGYAAAGLLFFAAGVALLGLDKDEIKRRLNPRRGKFMMLPIPLGNNERIEVGFGNVLTQLFRLIFQAYGYHSEDQTIDTGSDGNPYVRFARGRAAFLPSLAADIVSGKDYMGERITISEALMRRFIPFAIQAAFPRESETTYRQRPADALFTFFGFRTFPESDFVQERRLMDELSQEQNGKAFTDLTLAQRASVMTRFKQSDLWKKRTASPSDMERFITMAEDRRIKLEEDIDKSQTKRITELGLRVGPYRSTITIAGQAVPLTEEERELYHNLLVEEYNKALPDNYMKSLEKMSAVQRENAWSERQAFMRQTARGKLLRTLSN